MNGNKGRSGPRDDSGMGGSTRRWTAPFARQKAPRPADPRDQPRENAPRENGGAEHPGAANYPVSPPRYGHQNNSFNRYLPPLDDDGPPPNDHRTTRDNGTGRAGPRKLTVTRVAAMRSRQIAGAGIGKIHQAATADGADRSGLTALTWPTIVNAAVDAAMAIALANTLFFAAASAESKGKVALYLLVTIAPFALIAPLIGPALDRLQRGRRLALAASFLGRTVLALLIIFNSGWDTHAGQLTYDPWTLYPCALGMMVLSKSFGVLKSAVAPRVLPPTIDLVRVNSRLTTFGLVGGTIIGGGIASIFEGLLGKLLPFHAPGAMLWLAVISVVGAWLCMRIPAWVENTSGEVPTTLLYHGEPERTRETQARMGSAREVASKMRQPLGRNVVTGLWGNGIIRILTGFLVLYVAFYAKATQPEGGAGIEQLLILGAAGAAAGVGNFLGNAAGTRLQLRNPSNIVVGATAAAMTAAILAAAFNSMIFVTACAFTASAASAIGKVCLDASIQDDLPEESRASAFGRSETVLQLSWVIGASFGVLLPTELWIGFTVISVLLVIGTVQTFLTNRGSTMVPGLGGERPEESMPTGAIYIDRSMQHSQRPKGFR